MIICVSPDDIIVDLEANVLADRYQENRANFEKGCFQDLRQDHRLTFVGHGNRTEFGDEGLTPEMFVANLISYFPQSRIPDFITTIDLAGCGVGEVYDNTSYAKQVLELLAKHGYFHIQVNAFCNLVSNEPFAEIELRSNVLAYDKSVSIVGLSMENKILFDAKMRDTLNNEPFTTWKNKLETLLEKEMTIHKQILELKLASSSSDTLKKIKELRAQLPTIKQERKHDEKTYRQHHHDLHQTIYRELGVSIYSGNDIRRTLDNNPNFHHSQTQTTILVSLSKEKKSLLVSLYNRIAELKEDLYYANTSRNPLRLVKRFFEPSTENLTYQISSLTTLTERIKDPNETVESLYCIIYQTFHDEALSNKENDVTYEKILATLSVDDKTLEHVNASVKPQ